MKTRLSKPQVLTLEMIPKTYCLLSTTFEIRWLMVDRSVEGLSVGQWFSGEAVGWWSLVGELVKDLSVG